MTVSAESREWAPPHYDVHRLVGRGASSSVWEARQASTGRSVALKVLDADLTDSGDRRRFERERQAMGVLAAHPSIVTIFDAGVEAGHPWIAMELCRRGSLASVLKEHGPLAGAQSARVLVAMSDALGAVHAAGLLHCDVKPANVLVTDFGEPTLTDFGIARSGLGVSATTTMGGYTLDHVPPEVLDGQRHTAASDVYSLGTTVWQLLSARPPFREDADLSSVSVMRRILVEPLPPLTGADLPPDLVGLLAGMTAKSPAERPAMADVQAEARRILAGIAAPNGPTFPALVGPLPPTTDDVLTGARSDVPAEPGPEDERDTHLRAAATPVGTVIGPRRRLPVLLLGTAALAVVAVIFGTWALGSLSGPAGSGEPAAPVAAAGVLPTASPAVVTAPPTAAASSVPAPPPSQAASVATQPVARAAPVAPTVQAPVAPVPSVPSPAPAPTEIRRTVSVSSQVPVSSVDGGIDSGIAVRSGQSVRLSATGTVEYGYEGSNCVAGFAQTDPDGNRTVGGQHCPIKHDPNVPMPSAPVGALIGRIGQGSWFLVGSSRSLTADRGGELWLAHNDFTPQDDHGNFTVDVTVSG